MKILTDAPTRWTGYELMRHVQKGPRSRAPGSEYEQPARPIGFYSLPSRARLAWAVFTGRADALFWVWRPEE